MKAGQLVREHGKLTLTYTEAATSTQAGSILAIGGFLGD